MSHPAFPLPACPPRPREAACYGVQLDCNLKDPKEDLPAGRTGCSSPRVKEHCFCSGAQVFKYQNKSMDPEQSLCRYFPARAVRKCCCLSELPHSRVHSPSGQEPVAVSWASSSHFTTENTQGMPQTEYGIARAFIVPLDHTPGFGKGLAHGTAFALPCLADVGQEFLLSLHLKVILLCAILLMADCLIFLFLRGEATDFFLWCTPALQMVMPTICFLSVEYILTIWRICHGELHWFALL